jgi:four helix bundle protein
VLKYKSFEQTPVWQKGHNLVLAIYKITKSFPPDEKFALTAQLKRAVISIESNIAEAFGRFHYLDKLNFYYNSRGSVDEVKSQLISACDLQFIPKKEFELLKNDLEILKSELNRVIVSVRSRKT